MVPALRKKFNQNFSKEEYEHFLFDLNSKYPGQIEFRIAETPVFIDKAFGEKIFETCEYIIDQILSPDYLSLSQKAIPPGENVPNEKGHSHFIAFDFGICENEEGGLEPQLIEMQGFPTLYGFQVYYPETLRKHFDIPANFDHYFSGLNKETYLQLLSKVILGNHSPEEVILLEIKPREQKTRIDFFCTEEYLGIKMVCITELIREGKELFYILNGNKTRIKRIYNRVIFDDLNAQRENLGKIVDITSDLEVEWVPHPNWFYRISKYTLPFLHHPFIPETHFLHEADPIPEDLENYVIKPLFSFAGQGVIIDVTPEHIEEIKDRHNWIIQKKVKYSSVLKTPEDPAKVEIRMMYIWEDGAPRPIAATNLSRISKGKMIGVRYNKDKEWVGGSVCFFER